MARVRAGYQVKRIQGEPAQAMAALAQAQSAYATSEEWGAGEQALGQSWRIRAWSAFQRSWHYAVEDWTVAARRVSAKGLLKMGKGNWIPRAQHQIGKIGARLLTWTPTPTTQTLQFAQVDRQIAQHLQQTGWLTESVDILAAGVGHGLRSEHRSLLDPGGLSHQVQVASFADGLFVESRAMMGDRIPLSGTHKSLARWAVLTHELAHAEFISRPTQVPKQGPARLQGLSHMVAWEQQVWRAPGMLEAITLLQETLADVYGTMLLFHVAGGGPEVKKQVETFCQARERARLRSEATLYRIAKDHEFSSGLFHVPEGTHLTDFALRIVLQEWEQIGSLTPEHAKNRAMAIAMQGLPELTNPKRLGQDGFPVGKVMALTLAPPPPRITHFLTALVADNIYPHQSLRAALDPYAHHPAFEAMLALAERTKREVLDRWPEGMPKPGHPETWKLGQGRNVRSMVYRIFDDQGKPLGLPAPTKDDMATLTTFCEPMVQTYQEGFAALAQEVWGGPPPADANTQGLDTWGRGLVRLYQVKRQMFEQMLGGAPATPTAELSVASAPVIEASLTQLRAARNAGITLAPSMDKPTGCPRQKSSSP